ncbi:MAG TPA: PEP/pyruvate-binding domain-containing protein [Acidobacteriota bacterium]|nr:PEP/pyruvate-binding domain-containing protein [Acidobacteriota bacterium]
MKTNSGGESVDNIIVALQERAKELNCLYHVHELMNRSDIAMDEICRGLVEVIPPGWQYPSVCRARITLEGVVYEPSGMKQTEWAQKAEIKVQGEVVGTVEVFYTQEMPQWDEGPFLKEERRLIETIAERLAHLVLQQRMQSAFRGLQSKTGDSNVPERPEWWVIVDFLRETDPPLTRRIARRMINYLCWNGIEEAQQLLHRLAPTLRDGSFENSEDNRPMERQNPADIEGAVDATFRLAGEHLSEPEILSCIQRWLKDDKCAFLIQAVENQSTPLSALIDALKRYQNLSLEDTELSRSIQVGLRVALTRRFLSEDNDYINTAKNYIQVGDFYDLVQHVISPAASHGKLGGKSAGLFLASCIIAKSKEYADTLGEIKVPKTWYLTSDSLLNFTEYNHFQDLYNRKYLEIDQIRREYPHIVQVFKNSQFSHEITRGLSAALDDFEGHPLIVRSSSLLEDRMGAAFSGKYKSLFLANQGTKQERLAALMDAIAEVYASLFSPDPIAYRAERGLLDLHEEMGIMIQEVVGTKAGRYFFPTLAGVAFSRNDFRWSARIKREDGLLRIVPGLGTRAVDRIGDDFPVLVSPGQPGLRVNVTPDEIIRYSPRKIDVINMESQRFETVDIQELLEHCGGNYPLLDQIVSIVDENGVHSPMGLGWDESPEKLVVTFEGLIKKSSFIPRIRTMMRLLREKLGFPVDVEFAFDGKDLYLLQCRPQSYFKDTTPEPIPREVPLNQIIFSANRHVSSGRVPDISHIVFVDPDKYSEISDLASLKEVGRVIGRLNKVLPKRQFILMGPGRWGSRGDIKLGVSVTYSDINNTAVLIEIATQKGKSVPDVSFGTHFFQDLVEAGIRYLPLFPGSQGVVFNESFLKGSKNILTDLLPETQRFGDVIRVIDVPSVTNGQVLRVLMNGDIDEAMGRLAPRHDIEIDQKLGQYQEQEKQSENHWRWRLRMAQQIASNLDQERFAVQAFYVFGSTKNATAGPASDIDLLVHFSGTDQQREELMLWLQGWSFCLSEMNFLRTGYKTNGLLDVHIVTDQDIAKQTSYASKIGAITDAARQLPLGQQI